MRPGLFSLLNGTAQLLGREYRNDPLNWQAPVFPGYGAADSLETQAGALDAQALQVLAGAANRPVPGVVNPAFRTGDAVGALVAGLFGGQEGLAGYLQGKQGRAERDTVQRQQQWQQEGAGLEALARQMGQQGDQMRRQADLGRRNVDQTYARDLGGFQDRQKLAIDRREGVLDRKSREKIATGNVQGRYDVAAMNNATKLDIATRNAELKRFQVETQADSALWRTLMGMKDGGQRRAFAATRMRITDPVLLDAFEEATPQELQQMANAKLAEERAAQVKPLADSQINRNNAQARYSDARATWVDDVAQAQVNRANAAIRNYDSQINARGSDLSRKATEIRLKNVRDGIAAIDRELGQLRQGLRQAEKMGNASEIQKYQRNIAELRSMKQNMMAKGQEMAGSLGTVAPLDATPGGGQTFDIGGGKTITLSGPLPGVAPGSQGPPNPANRTAQRTKPQGKKAGTTPKGRKWQVVD